MLVRQSGPARRNIICCVALDTEIIDLLLLIYLRSVEMKRLRKIYCIPRTRSDYFAEWWSGTDLLCLKLRSHLNAPFRAI